MKDFKYSETPTVEEVKEQAILWQWWFLGESSIRDAQNFTFITPGGRVVYFHFESGILKYARVP